ncbi:MAG: S-layer homology domain-containing protein [Clostridia bacterium]|nr:S-layer homology domain-containing protein [Clostridia bacterium]
MKKIISLIISICLVFVFLIPSVYAYKNTTAVVSNVLLDDGTYSVTVKGSCEPDSYVSIYVIKEDGLGAVEQCDSDSAGFYSKTFPVETAGIYTVIVNNYKSNNRKTEQFRLYSLTDIEDAVLCFNTATNYEIIKDCIAQYGALFGFDTTYYTPDAEDYIASQLLNMKGTLTRYNISKKFDEACLRAYIYDVKTNIPNVLEYYDSLVGIANSDVGMYSEYKDMDTVSKARVEDIAFETPVVEIIDLYEIFFMAITEEKLKNGSQIIADEFLCTYYEYLGIDGYTDIPVIKRGKIVSALNDSKIPDNVSDFKVIYENIVSKIENKVPEKPSTGGGSGGGGGGGSSGGGTIIIEMTGYEEPVMLETPVPDVVSDITFTDLEGYSWAEEAIGFLASKGVVNGKEENKFCPADNITREEFAKIVVLAFGLYDNNATCNFTDVDEQRWSYKYIASMYGYGAVNGYTDGSFGAANPITREEMAVMLYRVMQKQSAFDFVSELETTLTDYSEISDFAKNSILSLNANKILSGDEKGCFNPKNNATRAEVCKMIYNSLNREGGR